MLKEVLIKLYVTLFTWLVDTKQVSRISFTEAEIHKVLQWVLWLNLKDENLRMIGDATISEFVVPYWVRPLLYPTAVFMGPEPRNIAYDARARLFGTYTFEVEYSNDKGESQVKEVVFKAEEPTLTEWNHVMMGVAKSQRGQFVGTSLSELHDTVMFSDGKVNFQYPNGVKLLSSNAGAFPLVPVTVPRWCDGEANDSVTSWLNRYQQYLYSGSESRQAAAQSQPDKSNGKG